MRLIDGWQEEEEEETPAGREGENADDRVIKAKQHSPPKKENAAATYTYTFILGYGGKTPCMPE